MSAPKSPWSWRRVAGLLALAAAVHVAAVWALPRLIMARLAATASAAEKSGTYLPPMTDHTQRRVVMPSPDLLYATCAFDVGERPLSIRVDPRGAGHQGYWSIALYASNSDNFYVLNDRQAGDAPVHIVLRSAASPGTAAGAPVDAQGCSAAQLVALACPCAAPAAGGAWKNHGQYVSCVAHASQAQVAAGLLPADGQGAIVSAAARSSCGK